ncbi:MAG: Undecaprenyl-phosphate mannosyltransferase [Phycisphaerae bacterium]|nr:Undecaprenyl-phosphate mannosyltransferase [Phycisphaerae bacterium]
MRSLVAIPVFNEIRHVDDVLDEVLGLHDDVLVIDDGSTDGTSDALAARRDIRLLRHPENRGYGQSLIDAFSYARRHRFDWLITMDCDRQHQPAQINQFLELATYCDCDLVSGSRYMIDMPGNDRPPLDRQSINGRITVLVNDVLGLEITDAFCGYKAYQVPALKWLAPTIPGYAFPMQHWVQVARAGFKMRELPVPIIYNDPKRHFGGLLDDPSVREQHYLDVMLLELIQPRQAPWQMMRLERDWTDLPIGAAILD